MKPLVLATLKIIEIFYVQNRLRALQPKLFSPCFPIDRNFSVFILKNTTLVWQKINEKYCNLKKKNNGRLALDAKTAEILTA